MKLMNLIFLLIFFVPDGAKHHSKQMDTANFFIPIAESRTYYVGTDGRNFYPGTDSLPFLTIQHAANLVQPGDTVIVKDGIYPTIGYNLLSISKSGTEKAPIVFKSQHKHGAKLSGLNSRGGYGIFITKGASWIEILNFEIEGFKFSGIMANDADLKSNYITIKGNNIHDIGRYETTTDYGLSAIYFRRGQHHWNIQGNLIYNIGRTGPDSYWFNKDHAVYAGSAEKRSEAAHHVTIAYNVIWGCSGHALNMGSDDDLIANNVFAWSNENHHYGKDHPHSGPCFITYDEETKNVVIANNIFYQPPKENEYAMAGYTTCEGWKVMNNLVVGGTMWQSNTPGRMACMAGNNYCSFGCEKRELNPMFVSASREEALQADFKLKSGSPCINKGINVGLKKDYLDHPIIGKPDIGAFESQMPE